MISLILLFGCGTPVEPSTEKSPVVEVAPRLPEYDFRLNSPELIASWQQETLRLAATVENPPDIAQYAAIEAKFTVDATSVAAYLDAVEPVYDYTPEPERQDPTPVVEKPTAESAKGLEAAHRHMDAGIQYAQLGDKTSAARCIKALEQKGEWNAAAIVAYEAGDKPKLFAMLDKMAERDDWDYRRRAIVSRAIADKKMALATEIATHCGWDITKGDWDTDLVAMGDPKATRAVKERQLKRWIEEVSKDCRDENDVVKCDGPIWSEDYHSSGSPVDEITEYAKQDRVGALALAKTYLDSRYSSVWYRRYTNERGPYVCNLEFYKLVRADASLKATYLGKVRASGQVVNQPQSMEGSLEIWPAEPPVPYRCLQSVKALGDKDLMAAWTDYLSAALAARHKVSRYEGGADYEYDIADCEDIRLRGHSFDGYIAFGRYVLGVPEGSLAVIDPVLYGTIAPDVLAAVWTELGLLVPEDSLTLEKVSETVATVSSLKHKGFEAEALKTVQGVLGATSPEKLDVGLGRLLMYELYLSIPSGKTDAVRATIRTAIDIGREGFEDARKQEHEALLVSLYLPYQVARHNAAEPGAEEKVFLTTNEEAQALVAPMLTELQTQAPKSYEFVVHGLVEVRYYTGGVRRPALLAEEQYRPLIDGEVKRLTEAGKTAELQVLLALLPYDYSRDYRR